MIENLFSRLRRGYELTPRSFSIPDALKRRGVRFTASSYTVKGLGNFCTAEWFSAFGYTKREWVLLVPLQKDMPLFSAEISQRGSRENLKLFLADVMLSPMPDEAAEAFRVVRSNYEKLMPENSLDQADSGLLDMSLDLEGNEIRLIKEAIVRKYFMTYLELSDYAPTVDQEQKRARIDEAAGKLLEERSPLFAQIRTLTGDEEAWAFYNSIF